MFFLKIFLIFVATYFGSAYIAALALEAISQKIKNKLSGSEIIVFALGLGPMTISLILFFSLHLFPDKSNSFYVISVLIPFLAGGIIFRNFNIKLIASCLSFKDAFLMKKVNFTCLVGIFIVSLVFIYCFIQAVGFPISSHDGCAYAFNGEYIYQQKNLFNYPMSFLGGDKAPFLPLEHPPGLPLLYTWFYLLLNTTSTDVLLRTVSPMYALYLACSLWLVIFRVSRKKILALAGVVLMVIAPLFVWQVYSNSIDPLRIFFIFVSFCLIADTLSSFSPGSLVMASFAAGFAAFIHVSGILAFFSCIFVYMIFFRGNIKSKILWGAVYCSTTCFVGGWQYLFNYLRFSNLLGAGTYALFSPAVKNFYDPVRLSTLGQLGVWKNILFGRLQIFFRPELFGIGPLAFLLGIPFWKKKISSSLYLKVIFSAAFVFAVPVIYKFYSNRRYIFSIYPVIIIFAVFAASSLYLKLKEKRLAKISIFVLFFSLLLPFIFLFMPNSLASLKLLKKKTPVLKYVFSNKNDQTDLLCPDFFDTVKYMNHNINADTLLLTYEQARYFYYCNDLFLYPWNDYRFPESFYSRKKEEIYAFLSSRNVTSIIIDRDFKGFSQYQLSGLKELLEDPSLVDQDYDDSGYVEIFSIKGDQLLQQ